MIVKKINITVEIAYSSQRLSAGTIIPIHDPDREINDQGLADYLDFLSNLKSLTQSLDFKITKEYFSDHPDSFSYYLTMYDKNQSTDEDIKLLFFIRISDHGYSKRSFGNHDKWYATEAEILKMPRYKRYQRFKVRSVIVNDYNYASYDDALDYIEDMILNLKDRY